MKTRFINLNQGQGARIFGDQAVVTYCAGAKNLNNERVDSNFKS